MSNITNSDLYILQFKYDADISKNCKLHICDSKGIKETKTINYDLYKLALYDADIGDKPAFV